MNAHAHAHALGTRKYTRAHTEAQRYNIYYFSTATMIRERASMLRYTYIVCLVVTQKSPRVMIIFT